MIKVEVTWVDSSGGGNWFHASEYAPHVTECTTVGFLFKETEEYFCIAGTIGGIGEDLQLNSPIVIPKCCVLEVKREDASSEFIADKIEELIEHHETTPETRALMQEAIQAQLEGKSLGAIIDSLMGQHNS